MLLINKFKKYFKKKIKIFKNQWKKLYKCCRIMYIITVKKLKAFWHWNHSSFSPLSYIIQEAVTCSYCFLNFKRSIILKCKILTKLTASFSYALLLSTSPSGKSIKVVQEAVTCSYCFLNFKRHIYLQM